jgi:signal transduction histidine kinase/CheY-like chemotaxis protein
MNDSVVQRPFLALRSSDGSGGTGQAVSTISLNVLVALVYAISGYAGLRLAFIGEAVTLFWPPSGIAFAALWLGGFRLLPGVGLGALAINIVVFKNPSFAAAVALGNMLPPLVGVGALTHMMRRRLNEGELGRVLWFILIGVLGATTLSATIGTLAVTLSGQSGSAIQSTWLVWWMGDAMGVLIIAPPILLWRRILDTRITLGGVRDATAFAFGGLAIIAGLLLIRNPIWAVELCKLFTLLLSLWAGARFGLYGPAAMTVLMAAGAVGVTMEGVGPFKRDNFYDSFTLVHSYLFAEAVAGMLLAAALSDLRRSLRSETVLRAEAEAASANRIRLLTMISHDVRTPLGGMMGVLQTLEKAGLPTPQERLVRLGLRAGRTLTTLMTDILDVARTDAGRVVLEPENFDVRQSLQDLVDLGAESAAAKGLLLQLKVVGPSPPPAVLGDRARIEQLFGNLIANAISYTPAGSVTVNMAWRPDMLQKLCVEVLDTGPGIDPAWAPHMFDAFALAPRPGNRSAGLGLGLHISWRLAQLMGGAIMYEPASSGGSRFSVTLPLVAVVLPLIADVSSDVDPPQDILLVEDDDIAREVTGSLLESWGHKVVKVAGGEAAIFELGRARFDLVLMDIQLEDGSGYGSGLDVTRRIRALPNAPVALSIIALTGDASEDFRAAYREAGIDGVLVKPLILKTGLAEAMQKSRW